MLAGFVGVAASLVENVLGPDNASWKDEGTPNGSNNDPGFFFHLQGDVG